MNKFKWVIGLLFLLVLTSCSSTNRELSPGNFAGFAPDGYMVVSTRVELDGKLDDLVIENGVMLSIRLAKGTESVEIYIIKFDKTGNASSFWYSWGQLNFNDLKVALSAIPGLYGELNGNTGSGYIESWLSGKWIYVFRGEKDSVKKTVKTFKEYKKEMEKSIES
ncbi:hypothetical protein AT15_02945 [Kosmotoga arenicorallina S304]|uniref:Uncharacterized protein n=1 Tax=Kosmotoga arenicorallina S304 TaxID=1453497 RepID=A0A176K440_9BACT|nr:hypothetical protein [Kosmotoga arenicorallina]OAA31801.1 hypothetical protein AT15_02945 [Kosmotoga arenicorallina S304]